MLKDLDITLTTEYHPDSLARDWRALEQQVRPEFFLSWHWVGTWLATLPSAHKPMLLSVKDGAETIALALLGKRRTNTLLGASVVSLALHESGDPALDVLAIEYNGLLAEERTLSRIWPEVLSFLVDTFKERAMDTSGRIQLSGIPSQLLEPSNLRNRVLVALDRTDYSPLVDLGKIHRAGEDGLISSLSRSARTLLKRSHAQIPGGFSPCITRANSTEQALEFFARLEELHQARWENKGMPGAFSSPYFTVFHRELIKREFNSGIIDIIKVTSGEYILGYLYNFRYRDVVYNYQGGFNYEKPRWRPGILSHQAAINWYATTGASTYDFLAGDSQYKRIFANSHRELSWGRVFKRSIRSSIENALRVARRATLARLRA